MVQVEGDEAIQVQQAVISGLALSIVMLLLSRFGSAEGDPWRLGGGGAVSFIPPRGWLISTSFWYIVSFGSGDNWLVYLFGLSLSLSLFSPLFSSDFYLFSCFFRSMISLELKRSRGKEVFGSR